MRIAKLRSSVDVFLKGGHAHAQLDHLTLMEINTVRPFLPHALDQIFRLKQVTQMHYQQICNLLLLFLLTRLNNQITTKLNKQVSNQYVHFFVLV